MDLTQNKLTKIEWESIEVPVSDGEKSILRLISEGIANIQIRKNMNLSMVSSMKIELTPEIEVFLYNKYFEPIIKKMIDKYTKPANASVLLQAAVIPAQKSKKKPNSTDAARLMNMEKTIDSTKKNMVEFVIIELCEKTLLSLYTHTMDYTQTIYTLRHILNASIKNINTHVLTFTEALIQWTIDSRATILSDMIHNSQAIFEKNSLILKYSDITLFEHQKRVFQIFGATSAKEVPKLVLYIAPTATGKTMTPLGLSETHRIIFVCMARHVGLALAKSAISMEKKVAFAFGCETASDVRLHYFAATDFIRNRKSGGIYKVDNSVGDKVEIMICDVKSYKTAMHYMLAFNDEQDIITFWDEPTITMDYETHELHSIIQDNWNHNLISKMVLSCATLPNEFELQETISDFRGRFIGAEICSIVSYDCKKTISILNKTGKCVLPHLLFDDYAKLCESVTHCEQMRSLLRYFDLSEIIRFIEYIDKTTYVDEMYRINAYFNTISDISIDSIKMYYLDVLKHMNVSAKRWSKIHRHFISTQLPMFSAPLPKSNELRKFRSVESPKPVSVLAKAGSGIVRTSSIGVFTTPEKIVEKEEEEEEEEKEEEEDEEEEDDEDADSDSDSESLPLPVPVPLQTNPFSGVMLTTNDAHTLTDGPTIYLAENIETIGKFCLAQAKIPIKVIDFLMQKIEYNNTLHKQIDKLEREIESKEEKKEESTDTGFKGSVKRAGSDKGSSKDDDGSSREVKLMIQTVNELRSQIVIANLEQLYIPNTAQHQQQWFSNETRVPNAFVANIDEDSIRDIMALDIDNQNKLLLLLGIGMFVNQKRTEAVRGNDPHTQYMEIMKRLAVQQQLFLIIAASDYIYGTNYQFCHGFIGKDLTFMTQQKTIQALGRIGRGNIQQQYTVRFRDDAIINQLFLPAPRNIEAEVMSKLMSGAAEWAENNRMA